MEKKLKEILEKSLEALNLTTDLKALEQLRIDYLGKKGEITSLMTLMKDLPNEEKPEFGKKVNEIKQLFEENFNQKKLELAELSLNKQLEKEKIDISLPATKVMSGQRHPLTNVLDQINELFIAMGYSIVEGPEVELDLYNFQRANIPADHPARDMQDTFFIDEHRLLRTHTTAIQTRVLEENANNLPIKLLCPGKTYRRDSDDATHSHQFMQIEGIVVDKNITLADLKGTLELLAKEMFGDKRTIRLRPSYFQFTEPSVEVDVSCFNCNGKGCQICKNSGWIEILGAGMVHPDVLEMAGIDSSMYSGFAFGLGIERTAMLKYGIEDIRSFYTNDLRFLKPFGRFE